MTKPWDEIKHKRSHVTMEGTRFTYIETDEQVGEPFGGALFKRQAEGQAKRMNDTRSLPSHTYRVVCTGKIGWRWKIAAFQNRAVSAEPDVRTTRIATTALREAADLKHDDEVRAARVTHIGEGTKGLTPDRDDPALQRQREEGRKGAGEGMQEKYLVLSDEEREKGYVRPVRTSYIHLTCGSVTTMGAAIAETYARDPHFYGGTFCAKCNGHFPVGENGEFVWDDDGSKVGS